MVGFSFPLQFFWGFRYFFVRYLFFFIVIIMGASISLVIWGSAKTRSKFLQRIAPLINHGQGCGFWIGWAFFQGFMLFFALPCGKRRIALDNAYYVNSRVSL